MDHTVVPSAGVQPTLDPYAEAFLYQAHCVNPGGEESG